MVWLFPKAVTATTLHIIEASASALPRGSSLSPASESAWAVLVSRGDHRGLSGPVPLEQSWHATGTCRLNWCRFFSGVIGTQRPDPADLGSDFAGCILCI